MGIPFLAFGSLFVDVAHEVRDNETLPLDRHVLLSIREHASPILDSVLGTATLFGGALAIVLLTAVATALIWKYVGKRHALTVLSSVVGAVTLNLILKQLFGRDRPSLWQTLVTEHGFSFPSGHAMASSALGFSLIIALWNTRFRYVTACLAAIYVLVIGFSRLYLGVHYPTDVLAGWLLSGAWVVLVTYIYYPHRTSVKAPAEVK
jgi:undecaprenyl-diphosphatase